MNENEDLKRRVTEAESKIRDLEDVVQTLAAENFDLRASLAEIKLILGLCDDQSDKKLSQNEEMISVRLSENSKEIKESGVEKEDQVLEEAPLLEQRQSLQNPEIHHEIPNEWEGSGVL